jgi:glycosyltransferase involved in cell wall biosynthesis
MTRELGIEGNVHYFGFKPLTEIADAIQFIHLGVVPNRLNAFTSINLPTRIFEYLAMNKPVIVPRTKGISDYFCDDNMLFFEPENIADLAEKIRWAYEHPQALSKLVQEGRKVYDQHSWAKEEKKLLEIVTQPHRRGY